MTFCSGWGNESRDKTQGGELGEEDISSVNSRVVQIPMPSDSIQI